MRSVLLACLLVFVGVLPAQGAKVLWLPFDHNENPPDCGFGCYSGHGGSDYNCPQGTNIYASIGGTVITAIGDVPGQVCDAPNYGNYVKIQNDTYHLQVIEAHLLQGSVVVYGGQTVVAGQYIGKSSNSGYTMSDHDHDGDLECGYGGAYHLHLEARAWISNAWVPVDPYSYDGGLWTDPLLYGNDTPPPPPQPTFVCSWVSQSITPSGPYHVGDLVQCEVRFKNEGTATWLPTVGPQYVELASCNGSAVIGESFFNYPYDSGLGWENHYVPVTFIQDDTQHGETATFQFTGRIRDIDPGTYPVYFGPCFDGAIVSGWGQMQYEVTVIDPPPSEDAFTPCPGDYTGDGKVDVGVYHQPTGGWYVAVSTGSAFTPSTTYWLNDWGTDATCHPLVGDFDDDSKSDVGLYHPGDGAWYVALSTGSAFTPSTTYWLIGWGADSTFQALVGDFNGDGKSDVGMYHQPTGGWYVALSDGSSFTPSTTYWLNGWGTTAAFQPFVGDFNGDGKSDVGLYHQPTGGWYVALSTGSAFTPSSTYWLNGWGTDTAFQPLVGDFTGDGKDDVGLYHYPTGGWYVAASSGSAFTPSGTSWLEDWGTDDAFQPLVGDFTGGGDVDVGMYHPPTGGWYVATSSGTAFTASQTYWLDNWGVNTNSSKRQLPDVSLPKSRTIVSTLFIRPNPASGNVGFRWSLPSLDPATLFITDASGRVVFTRRITGLGSQELVWDRRDTNGRTVATGVYFARIQGVGGNATRKLVIVR